MKMYRTGWLVAGIALLVVGVGAAALGSPRAPLIASWSSRWPAHW